MTWQPKPERFNCTAHPEKDFPLPVLCVAHYRWEYWVRDVLRASLVAEAPREHQRYWWQHVTGATPQFLRNPN